MKFVVFTWISMLLLLSNLYVLHVVSGECILDEKTVLLQIRREITYNSSASTKVALWDERVDCCHWPGLSCNDAGGGYISSLDLSDDESISSGFNLSLLLKLPSLSVIKLDKINFSAPFPDFFPDFTNLTVLSLKDCNFTGIVPHEIFQVPTLQTIDLSFNEILGGSLQEFPENGSLQVLQLGNTMFSGNLPESIGNLRLLSYIDLSDCDFSGPIPVSFRKLTKLVEVFLVGNHFSGSIPSFKQSKNLTVINLQWNDFAGEIPFSHWDGLHNLEVLYLHVNSFSGPIPESLFFLPSLQLLILSNNKFSGQINELRNVTSPMEILALSSNNLEGPIPSFFFQLQKLSVLALRSNKFNDTVHLTKFRNPKNINTLDLSHNKLVVETNISPLEFPSLPQFETLMLASCNVHEFPKFLKNQSTLQYLDLSSNGINGEIPNWIWGIGNGELFQLNLSHNHLKHMQGPIEYDSLYVLDLHSNRLSGRIPRPPREAVYLDLSSNNFSSMPLDIGDHLPNVTFFSIAKNRVGGKIPASLCRAAHLEVLDMSNNNLKGTIPLCLVQNYSNLGVINVKQNHLSGEIPHMFLDSCSLETLDLSHNHLQGKIPPSLANCTKVKVLNLESNKLSDTFPCWLNKLPKLHILVLRSNNFDGSISCPIQLKVNNSWPSLKVIDLASNNFSGLLPADLFLELIAIVADSRNEANSKLDYLHYTASGNGGFYYDYSVSLSFKGVNGFLLEKVITTLTSIDFSSNNFEGSIPESVGELKMLRLLNFSHNALIGSIPQSLENLKELEALDLSVNNLSGNIPVQLLRIKSMSFLNLSYNHLVGRIPQGYQFNTFGASSFIGNGELCGIIPLNVSCSGIKEPASVQPKSEEKQLSDRGDIYASVAIGFAVGLGGIFVPLLLSSKWRSYYNKKIDEILSKIFFQKGQGRRKKSR